MVVLVGIGAHAIPIFADIDTLRHFARLQIDNVNRMIVVAGCIDDQSFSVVGNDDLHRHIARKGYRGALPVTASIHSAEWCHARWAQSADRAGQSSWGGGRCAGANSIEDYCGSNQAGDQVKTFQGF